MANLIDINALSRFKDKLDEKEIWKRDGYYKNSIVPNDDQNYNAGQYSFAHGHNVVIPGYCAHAEGEDTNATGSYSHAEGKGVNAFGPYCHAMGKYNYANNSSTIMMVGVGTSDNSRKNAFEILDNGQIYVDQIGEYNGTNSSNSAVLSLQRYIESLNNQINTLTQKLKPEIVDVTYSTSAFKAAYDVRQKAYQALLDGRTVYLHFTDALGSQDIEYFVQITAFYSTSDSSKAANLAMDGRVKTDMSSSWVPFNNA